MTDKNIRPLFIVFEGLDGSGKTTQLHRLADKLREMGHKVHVTAEPTDFPSGKLLRSALRGDFPSTPAQLAALFLNDRIVHNTDAEGIEKYLADGYTVLCDRYYYSSMAYQGADTDFHWVADINLNCPDIRRPDGCILFDISAEVCMQRVDSRNGQKEIYETVAKQTVLREKFARIKEYIAEHSGEPMVTVNADGTLDEVEVRVWDAYLEIANSKG